MFETVRDRVFPFIKSIGLTEGSDAGSTYTHHMQDALFMMPTARVLANVVDQLDDIDMADRDTKGDLYEYMLGKIATAGQNGQFRTPRHIIRLMVDMTAPTPKDVICDPACGTAGFLVAASEHLVEHHGDRIYKNAEARHRFNQGAAADPQKPGRLTNVQIHAKPRKWGILLRYFWEFSIGSDSRCITVRRARARRTWR